jgi:hypothetical protein
LKPPVAARYRPLNPGANAFDLDEESMGAVVVPFDRKRKSSVPPVGVAETSRRPGPVSRLVRRTASRLGGSPTGAVQALPITLLMLSGMLLLFVGVPWLISILTGWEPRRWQIAGIVLLAFCNFLPVAISFKRMVWPARGRRYRE